MRSLSIQLLLFFFLVSTVAFSQQVDSISKNGTDVFKEVKIKSKQASHNDSLEVSITIDIQDFKNVNVVQLRYGLENGSGDIVSMDLQYVKIDGKEYLQYSDKLFPVTNGKIVVTGVGAKSSLNKSTFLILTVKDASDKELSILNRQY